jgi:hypothetical protein
MYSSQISFKIIEDPMPKDEKANKESFSRFMKQ